MTLLTDAKALYVGSTPATAVYIGAEKVWPAVLLGGDVLPADTSQLVTHGVGRARRTGLPPVNKAANKMVVLVDAVEQVDPAGGVSLLHVAGPSGGNLVQVLRELVAPFGLLVRLTSDHWGGMAYTAINFILNNPAHAGRLNGLVSLAFTREGEDVRLVATIAGVSHDYGTQPFFVNGASWGNGVNYVVGSAINEGKMNVVVGGMALRVDGVDHVTFVPSTAEAEGWLIENGATIEARP